MFEGLNFVGLYFCAEIEKGESSSSVKQEKAESLFTARQLQELYYQTLVFNFIVYGFSTWDSDHEIMTDPELGRCRRTDGRKWRCSNNALPKEKYCERHMHRGRKRSRKHVEKCLLPNNQALTSNNRVMSISSPMVSPHNVELKRSITEDEPQRCKRTDGKRWRCGKEVIPGQNYCETHMHRGVKRVILDSELGSVAQFTVPQRGSNSPTMPKVVHSSINLNVKPASPRDFTECKSSRSSDATVSDELVSTCNTPVMSP